MKKLLGIVLPLLICFFYSCNNVENKNTAALADSSNTEANKIDRVDDFLTKGCDSAGGLANFLIDSLHAVDMIKNFNDIYKRDDKHADIRAFLNSYWIDSCTITSIATFLKKSNRYDGIRIYFGCALVDSAGYDNDPYKKKTTLFIYPTYKRKVTDPKMSEHMDSLEVMPTDNCSLHCEYIKPPTFATSEIYEFNRTYRKSTAKVQKDSLSKSIWIDSCVIFTIQNVLRNFSTDVDGVNIRTAAYLPSFTKTISGKIYKNQSTILIVPSSPSNGGKDHLDNWNIIQKILDKHNYGSALNHGELCPQVCN
jgi:hypothetical protein